MMSPLIRRARNWMYGAWCAITSRSRDSITISWWPNLWKNNFPTFVIFSFWEMVNFVHKFLRKTDKMTRWMTKLLSFAPILHAKKKCIEKTFRQKNCLGFFFLLKSSETYATKNSSISQLTTYLPFLPLS